MVKNLKKDYTKYIGIRLKKEVYDLLIKASSNRGEDVSDFVRRAILKELANLELLDEEQKRYLGVV
jgi:uncharacterized protein (DUF1778 family)